MVRESLRIIPGRPISSGLAEGRTFVHRDILRAMDGPIGIQTENIEREFGQLENATATITHDLLTLATRVENEMGAQLAAVFEAHQLMLNDPILQQELRTEIRQNLVSAASAVKAVFLRWEKRFLLMESQVARHKGDDMRDISTRLSNALAGVSVHPLDGVPPGSVLVAQRLLPSDTVFLARRTIAAVLLEHAGAGSHAALFLREMGIPCLADISAILEVVPAGLWALVDANQGEVTVQPRAEQESGFRRKVEAQQQAFSIARLRALEPAITRDGITVAVLANVGSRADTERAMANGADGIGLYRTERAYLGRVSPPGEDELVIEMRQTLELARAKPMCIRLLDIGGDKPFPFIGFLAESNPALGRRGIRLLREYPRLLETQLRAILKLSAEFDVRILVPMIALQEDVIFVKEWIDRLVTEAGYASRPKLGAMIETPAAALSVRDFEPHVDFLSFGTNDLTQYSFAADRENVAVDRYFNDSAPVIFRLLRIAHDDAPELPLSICGELAGRLGEVPRLLQCGIRALSVAPHLIPGIKEVVRESSCQEDY